jgi:hypothetical protein
VDAGNRRLFDVERRLLSGRDCREPEEGGTGQGAGAVAPHASIFMDSSRVCRMTDRPFV